MANPIIHNYLNGLGSFYGLNPADQQVNQQQPAFGEILPRAGLNIAPVIGGFGSNNGTGGYLPIVTGVNGMAQARQYQKEDREENRATSAACIGAILTVVGAAGLACVMNSWNETTERLDQVRAFRDDELPHFTPDQKARLTPIVNKDISILEKRNSQARNIVLLTATALASAVTAFVAGMFSVQWLITVAIVVGVATLAIGTFLTVSRCLQKSETPMERAYYQDLVRQHQWF
jgi:hypothetical protein